MLRFGSLKTRIVVLTTIPLSALLVTSLAITNDIGKGAIRRGVESSLADAGAVFVNLLTARQRELLTMATVTAKDPRFFATFSVPAEERGEEFGPTMHGLARDFLLITGADFIEIFDAAGEPVAAADREFSRETADPRASEASLHAAMGGRAVTDVFALDNQLVVAAAVPVYLNDHLEAVLRIGNQLGGHFAEQVQRLTSARVCLSHGAREFTSTFPEGATGPPPAASNFAEHEAGALGLAGFSLSDASTIRRGDTDYLMVSVSVAGLDGGDGLTAYLGRELRQQLATMLGLETKIAIFGALALLLTFTASWILAKSVTRPISSIVQAAAEVQRGNYDHPIEVRGSDEVAFLARRFLEMRSSLARHMSYLRSVDKMKSNFIALAGHELKTPLTIVSGFNQLIGSGSMGSLPKDVRETSALIQERLTDLNQLVQNMLDLSALEQGVCDFAFEGADLRPIIDSEVHVQVQRAKGRKLTVEWTPPSQPVRVRMDAARLAQALGHLLDNAIRYTPDGGRVTVALRQEAARALLSVKDTGMGIAAEEIEWIFEKVYESRDVLNHSSVKNQFGSHGFGLGLPLCKAIVAAHQGEIKVNSALGRGSEFTIVLPTSSTVPRSENQPAPAAEPALVSA